MILYTQSVLELEVSKSGGDESNPCEKLAISEYEIIEIAENVCNLKKEEADWMLKIDIVEKGDKLQVIGYADTDVAEYIYKAKPDLASLVNHLCKDLTDACTKNPPHVPKTELC